MNGRVSKPQSLPCRSNGSQTLVDTVASKDDHASMRVDNASVYEKWKMLTYQVQSIYQVTEQPLVSGDLD